MIHGSEFSTAWWRDVKMRQEVFLAANVFCEQSDTMRTTVTTEALSAHLWDAAPTLIDWIRQSSWKKFWNRISSQKPLVEFLCLQLRCPVCWPLSAKLTQCDLFFFAEEIIPVHCYFLDPLCSRSSRGMFRCTRRWGLLATFTPQPCSPALHLCHLPGAWMVPARSIRLYQRWYDGYFSLYSLITGAHSEKGEKAKWVTTVFVFLIVQLKKLQVSGSERFTRRSWIRRRLVVFLEKDYLLLDFCFCNSAGSIHKCESVPTVCNGGYQGVCGMLRRNKSRNTKEPSAQNSLF